MLWRVYLLRCADNSLYCGISNDIEARIAKHNSGKGAKYTRSRRPVKLITASRGLTKSDALKLERAIKQKPAKKKIEALKSADSDPVNIIKNKFLLMSEGINQLRSKIKQLSSGRPG